MSDLQEVAGVALPAEGDTLALYYTPACGFCHRVIHAMEQLGVEMPMRNLWSDKDARAELLDARGRGTVPVLRVHRTEGDDDWMPESADIIEYLRTVYG